MGDNQQSYRTYNSKAFQLDFSVYIFLFSKFWQMNNWTLQVIIMMTEYYMYM